MKWMTRLLLVAALCHPLAACNSDDDDTTTDATMDASDGSDDMQGPPREGPPGCYIPSMRMCDCDIAEADCSEDVGVWTEGCASCEGASTDEGSDGGMDMPDEMEPEADAGDADDMGMGGMQGAGGREGPEGCYIPEMTMCNCDLTEEECPEDVGIWTPGCTSCAAE